MKQLLTFFCVCLLALPLWAAEPYVVRGVTVDVTAETAAKARNQAFAEAQRKAFINLAAQLSPDGVVPEVSDSQLGNMVSNFNIDQERAGGNRYTGTFTFRFRQNPVRTVFGAAPIPSPTELAARGNAPRPIAAAAPVVASAELVVPKPDEAKDIIASVAKQDVTPQPVAMPVLTEPKIAAPMAPQSASQFILIEVPAQSARELSMARDKMQRTSGVAAVDYRSISTRGSVLRLGYNGNRDALLQNLSAAGVRLLPKAPTQPPLYQLQP